MATPSVLNPKLYARLQKVFGKVRVSNNGSKFAAVVGTDPVNKRRYLSVQQSGEYYHVCCPFCGDGRFRLTINHMWDRTYKGHDLKYMAVCYNEHCEQDRAIGFRNKLSDMLQVGDKFSYAPGILMEGDDTPTQVEWPGEVCSILDLPEDHNVRKYLRSRGFDDVELANDWDFKWILNSDRRDIWDTNRLLIPGYAYRDGELALAVWQTRWFDCRKNTGDPPNARRKALGKRPVPKYLSHGKKSQVVYNGYRAAGNSPVVVCEGVMDAIRIGKDHGVCIYGKSMSEYQKQLLWSSWGQHGAEAVLAVDPDVSGKEYQKLVDAFSNWKNLKCIKFPEGRDVADYTREELTALIESCGIKFRTKE